MSLQFKLSQEVLSIFRLFPGTTVFPLLYNTAVDPALWGKDHMEFRPERHIGPDGNKLKDTLLTFGTGMKRPRSV